MPDPALVATWAAFRQKLEALLAGKLTIAKVERLCGFQAGLLKGWLHQGYNPRLDKVQALAGGTTRPVCYWADDGWKAGESPAEIAPACPRVRAYGSSGTDPGMVSDGTADIAADGEALSAAERAVVRELEGLWEAIPQAVESIRAGRMRLASAAALAEAVHTLSRLIEDDARGA